MILLGSTTKKKLLMCTPHEVVLVAHRTEALPGRSVVLKALQVGQSQPGYGFKFRV